LKTIWANIKTKKIERTAKNKFNKEATKGLNPNILNPKAKIKGETILSGI